VAWKHSLPKIHIFISRVVGPTHICGRTWTERKQRAIQHLNINGFNSCTNKIKLLTGENTRVSPYPRRRYADVGRHVQRNTNTPIQNTKTKNETVYLMYMSRRLRRALLAQTANQGAPRSCPGQKSIRRVEPKKMQSKQEYKQEWSGHKTFPHRKPRKSAHDFHFP